MSSDCKTKHELKCETVTWQECWEEPIEICSNKTIKVPCQKRVHQEQCLFHDHDQQRDHDRDTIQGILKHFYNFQIIFKNYIFKKYFQF